MATLAELWDTESSTKDFTQFPKSRGVTETHKGTDYAIPLNTPITANISGTIRYKTNDPKGYGNAVEILDDKGNVVQRYAHLNEFSVPNGSKIEAGQVLGKSGNTGRSTGPHLHFEDFQKKDTNKQTGETLADLWDKTPATITEQPIQEKPQETGAAFGNPMLARQGEKAREAGGGNLQSIVGGITDALKTMSIPDWQKESILANMLKYGVGQMPIVGDQGFHEEGKNKLIESGKSIVNAVMNPKETYEAISQQEPGALLGQMVKGAIYDAPLGPSAKPIENVASAVAKPVISATGEVIKPVISSFKPVKEALSEAFTEIKKSKGVENKPLEQKSTLSGAGAAEVGQENLRIAKARELPIPIELSKDQATRSPADVRFARETAKNPVLGQPLQEKYAGDNAKIQQNLDHLIHETGAEFTEAQPSTVGKMLRDSVEKARNAQKQKVETAYQAAKENGETAELVNAKSVQKYLDSLEAEEINAPVITSAKIKLKKLIDNEGNISINDLEEIRKLNNTLSQSSPTNGHFAKEINEQIDAITEGKGGENYRLARDENIKLNDEFNNNSIVQDIIGKTNKEYKNALAELGDKVMIKGTAEEITHLFNVLDQLGPEGQIIKNELRGHVAQHIKNRATNGVQLDINGKPYVNTKNLDSVISALDRSDKLELLFGKKNAEHYRTLNEVTKDVQTIPKDVTNPSGTAATVLGALAEMGIQGATTGIPIPIAMIGKQLYKHQKTKQKLNKISDFVNYSKEK